MTSASELFYNRRSRYGRNSLDIGSSDNNLASPPPPISRRIIRNHHHHNTNTNNNTHSRRDRIDPDVCEPPLRRPRQPPLHRPPSHPPQERESIRQEHGIQPYTSGNISHSVNQSNPQDRLRSNGNDRLPGAVLLARERLLQRLRGVTLSGSWRSNRSSPGNHRNDTAIRDEFRLVDAGDWETEISSEWLAAIAPLTDSISQQISKRPPGLSQEALNSLCIEVFAAPEEGDEEGMSRAIRECSICLESFSEGDELIRLPCGHRYHFCCLDPWIRTCGDCPYCRRCINVNIDVVK